MFQRADLHIHTTSSDGDLTPLQVIQLAKSRMVDAIAVTDHNSVAAIQRAYEAGTQYDISVIPGIELSVRLNGESIHILGYFKDNKYLDIQFHQILKLIKAHKASEIRKQSLIFSSKLSKNSYLSVEEGIALLKNYGAAVVLAHPLLVSPKNLSLLLEMPFDGLEARYCRSNDYDTNRFIREASSRSKFYTGGSDFHTDKLKDARHCLIGDSSLNSSEINNFLSSSGALVLGMKTIEY